MISFLSRGIAVFACVLLLSFGVAFALEGESIVFNPATGNYLITYKDSLDEKFHQVTFIPATKVNPTFNTKLQLEKDGIIHYGYTLISGWDSQQVIVNILLNPVSSVTTSLPDIPFNAPAGQIAIDMLNVAEQFETPLPWRAAMGYSESRSAFRIGWYYNLKSGGLVPGDKAVFSFKSLDLPGIIQAEVYGYAPDSKKIPAEETQDAEDGGFGQQYTELVFRKNFVPRNAAVPTIAVPTPFDPAVMLERIQIQMHTWIAMQLIDSAFSSQLDRNFQSAADAYRKQGQAGNGQIGKMLALLVQQYEELEKGDEELVKKKSAVPAQIDKLAALVLYFDLKYVMRRASGGN